MVVAWMKVLAAVPGERWPHSGYSVFKCFLLSCIYERKRKARATLKFLAWAVGQGGSGVY